MGYIKLRYVKLNWNYTDDDDGDEEQISQPDIFKLRNSTSADSTGRYGSIGEWNS
jgi:hypothetical protein